MTWPAFHRRADVPRAVTDEADRRLDAHAAGTAPAESVEESAPGRSHLATPRGSAAFVERLKAALAS